MSFLSLGGALELHYNSPLMITRLTANKVRRQTSRYRRGRGVKIKSIKSNQIYLLKKKKKKKKQQDTKAGKPALTWAQQKGTIKQ